MAIQGNLDSISLPDLFSLIGQLRKTGVLSLVTRVEERSFLFFEGQIVHATSREESRRLGHFLVRLGFFEDGDVEELSEVAPGEEPYLGRRLLQSGLIEQWQLSAAVQAQVLDILREVLTWNEGAFVFDDRDPPYEVLDEHLISTQTVLFEAARMTDERSYVQSLFPDTKLVLARSDEDGEESDEEVRALLELIDGERDVEELFLSSEAGAKSTAVTLKRLLDTGRLHVRSESTAGTDVDRLAALQLCPLSPESPGLLYTMLTSGPEDAESVTRILANEPMLMAKILRLLTLTGTTVHRDDLSVSNLANRMGEFQLRCLLLAESARGARYPVGTSYVRELWEHSRAVAQLCRFVAIEVGYESPGEAYLAGLLHNIGAFLLAQSDPTKYRETLVESIRDRRDIEEIERERFGQSHTEIGAICAERWRLPSLLTLVIRHHHQSEEAQSNALLQILTIANGLAQASGQRVGHHARLGVRFEDALRRANLDRQQASAFYQRIVRPQGIEELLAETAG